jgi:hypothetical protein
MLEETVNKIEAAIGRIGSLETRDKAEILGLLESLKSEVSELSRTHGEHARSIAGLAEIAAHEAGRREKSPGLLKHSLEGLALSARGFEDSHPRLVRIVDGICVLLARMGI